MNAQELRRAAVTARDLVLKGAVLTRDLQGRVGVRQKEGGQGPVTEADFASERAILDGLAAEFPGDPVLAEETSHGIDLEAPRIWCVDPLDGTKEYTQGRHDYAVMAGLLLSGEPVAGAVALPAENRVFWGWRGGGAFQRREGGPDEAVSLRPTTDLAEAIAIHSRSHRSERLEAVLACLGIRNAISAGSVGYKVAQILLGKAHVYAHPGGGTKWWDSVGPAAILLAAGGSVSAATGHPLRYEGTIKHGDGLLFCAPGLGERAAQLIRDTL